MSSEGSTALAVRKPDQEAEKLPPEETITIPAAIMLAAETVADPKGNQDYLRGIYIHSRDRRGRVVSTDGKRMFVASFPVEGKAKMPSWMTAGVLLDSTGLKARLAMIAKGNEAQVKLAHVRGTYGVKMSDTEDDMIFNLGLINRTFPDYEKVLGADSFVNLDGDGNATGQEWKPIGIGSGYLKQCGDIARLLDNGRPKSEREKTGMVVRAFTGDPDRPIVFDFPGWPGAILLVMPMKISGGHMSKETAALVAPAVKASVAALRAHSTRWLQVAKAATNDLEREAAIAKSKEFQQRVAVLLDTAPIPQLGGKKGAAETETPVPEMQPEPEVQPEAEAEAETQPEDQATNGPTVKRRKIKVKVPSQQHQQAAE